MDVGGARIGKVAHHHGPRELGLACANLYQLFIQALEDFVVGDLSGRQSLHPFAMNFLSLDQLGLPDCKVGLFFVGSDFEKRLVKELTVGLFIHFIAVVEEGCHLVVLALRNRIELMIVAARATECQAEKR